MIAIMTLTELSSMLSIELQVNADPKTARYSNRSIEEGQTVAISNHG